MNYICNHYNPDICDNPSCPHAVSHTREDVVQLPNEKPCTETYLLCARRDDSNLTICIALPEEDKHYDQINPHS